MQYNIFYNPVQFLAFFVFVFSCTKPIILTTMSIQVVGSVGYSGTAWLQCEALRKEKQFHGNCMLQHQTCHLMPRLLTVLYLGREQNINWRKKTLNAKGHYPFFSPREKKPSRCSDLCRDTCLPKAVPGRHWWEQGSFTRWQWTHFILTFQCTPKFIAKLQY